MASTTQRMSDAVRSARGYNRSIVEAKKVGAPTAQFRKFRDMQMKLARGAKTERTKSTARQLKEITKRQSIGSAKRGGGSKGAARGS